MLGKKAMKCLCSMRRLDYGYKTGQLRIGREEYKIPSSVKTEQYFLSELFF